MHELQPGKATNQLLGTRTYGLVMIGVGVAALVLATLQHRHLTKRLKTQYPQAPKSLSRVLAVLIASLGILALVTAFLQE